jgi:cation-transporting ATPase E
MEFSGLSSQQVSEKVKNGEQNNAVIRSNRSYFQIIITNLLHPPNLILIISVAVLFTLENTDNSSNFSTAIFVVLNTFLGLIQEIRAKRELDKLSTLNVSTVCVRRDGKDSEIPIDQIVKDDIIKLRPGDPVVVDGPVLFSNCLEVDESALTGESEYIPKYQDDYILSGAFCTTGTGFMKAEKIGKQSHLYQLSKTARAFKTSHTRLEKNMDILLRILVAVTFLLVFLNTIKDSALHLSVARQIIEAIIIIFAVVPQGLIFAITVGLAYGAIKMTRLNTIVHRLNAIESMGEINILCADKTGTLTENKLTLKEIIPLKQNSLEAIEQKLANYAKNLSWMNKTVLAISSYVKVGSENEKA